MSMSDTSLSPARTRWLAAQRRRRGLILFAKIALLLGFLLGWELSARLGWIDAFIMSSPSRIAAAIWRMTCDGSLFPHLLTTCAETAAGFVLGTLLGSLIAALLWWSPFAAQVLEPYLVILNALPKVALGPVIIVWVGAGPKAILLMALAISLIVTVLEVFHSFNATDTEMLTLLRAMGAGKLCIFRLLVLPGNLPAVINALKVNVGLSWVGVIMGEFLVSKAGIGYLIVYGSQVFQMDLVMAGVLLLTCAAALMYRGIVLLEKVLIRHIR